MAKSSLPKKLHMKPGQRAVVINPPPGCLKKFEPLPEGVELAARPTGKFDFVLLFAKDTAELKRLVPKAIRAVKPDALLWICYPKGSSKVETDLNRDVLGASLKDSGLIGVSLVSFDDVWSAMRFRPIEAVGK